MKIDHIKEISRGEGEFSRKHEALKLTYDEASQLYSFLGYFGKNDVKEAAAEFLANRELSMLSSEYEDVDGFLQSYRTLKTLYKEKSEDMFIAVLTKNTVTHLSVAKDRAREVNQPALSLGRQSVLFYCFFMWMIEQLDWNIYLIKSGFYRAC